jgi:nascent polypeptide-associated complex subunit alpha|tara:strand:- start:363 stop:722 length:360 start_codon:yes stop_codon:yes gene_type:complete
MMPGMGRMNPRMMKKLQKQLQSSTEEIDATEVIIRTKEKELHFSNPSVSAMNLMGQQTYQIVGEPQERSLGGEEDSQSIPNEDIELVASQAGVSNEEAQAALEECGGEPAEAIIKLMGG